jgi:WD40 repeat protein
MAIDNDGSRLAVAGLDGTIRIWSLPDLRVVSTIQGEGPVRAMAMAPDASFLVSEAVGNGSSAGPAFTQPASCTDEDGRHDT